MAGALTGRMSSLAGDIRRAWGVAASPRDFVRLSLDLSLQKKPLYRLFTALSPRSTNKVRTVRLKGGIRLAYRLNRGDIWTLREVWLHEAYRLPVDVSLKSYVDLGCNIGLTMVWYHQHYGPRVVVGVEPVHENIEIARQNAKANGIEARFYEAAVSAQDGEIFFADSEMSNMGHIADKGTRIPAVSLSRVLDETVGSSGVDLLKMDIEGGEQALLEGDRSWLARVRNMIVEFHPALIDHPRVVELVRSTGMKYVPSCSAGYENMEFFHRAG